MTKKKERGKQRCIYLPHLLDKQLADYAEQTGLPISYIIKTSLKEFLASVAGNS